MSLAVDKITIEGLERELVRLAEALELQMARWLSIVAEFDSRGGAKQWGFRSTAEWLSWRCAVGPRAAREHVRVARRLTELPLVQAALAAGELSFSKARALTRTAATEDEAGLLELARSSTAWELERTVAALRSAPTGDVETANNNHRRRRLDWWWDADGSLCFIGRLAADEGAALVEALEAGAEALHAPAADDGSGEERPARPNPGARRVDALTEIVCSGAPRAQVVLHVDEAALACTATAADERQGGVCVLQDGPAVPSETARRLACDAEVVNGHGRRRRVVSPALRTALERRDGHCRYPGCARRHGTHAHHIRHWAHGGATDPDNLVLLCRFHHRLVHEEGFAIRRHLGELAFVRPDGRLVPALPGRPGHSGRPPPEALAA